MSVKSKINLLFFCLYLGSIGKYFLNEIIDSNSTDTVITLIIDILIVVLTLSFIKLKSKYMNYIYIFIVFSSISYLMSVNTSLLAHINGIRETLIFICYFVIMDILHLSRQTYNINNKFSIFTYIFLTIQIPVTILQFIEFGAGDAVGGTFGLGGSGLLTFSIFMLIYYLIENKSKIPKDRIKKGLPLLIFLIPIALNETKISFVFLLLFFISFANIKKINSSVGVILLGILTVICFSFIYTTKENVNYKNPLEGIFSNHFLNEYLLGDENTYEDVPRFTKIIIGTEKLTNDGDLFLGKDYGAFMGSQLKINSEFSKKYQWLLKGSVPYTFYLLISGGIFLLLFINWMVFSEIFRKHNNNVKNYSPSFLFFLTALFIIILFYNDGLRSPVFSFLFVFLLFFSKYHKKQLKSRKSFII